MIKIYQYHKIDITQSIINKRKKSQLNQPNIKSDMHKIKVRKDFTCHKLDELFSIIYFTKIIIIDIIYLLYEKRLRSNLIYRKLQNH